MLESTKSHGANPCPDTKNIGYHRRTGVLPEESCDYRLNDRSMRSRCSTGRSQHSSSCLAVRRPT